MRKIMLLCLVLAPVVAWTGSAETVLLYIGNQVENEEVFKLCLPSAYSLEDGVMNEFFDSGHIIFNAGVKKEYSFTKPPFDSTRMPVRMAKRGGARYLLEVNVIYKINAKNETPKLSSAGYTLTNVYSEDILGRGNIEMEDVRIGPEENPEAGWYSMGQYIARHALEMW
jgi:hypothetical protein